MKKSFLLFKDSLCVLDDLTDEQRGQLFYAIYKYQMGEEITMSPLIKIAFSQFKNQFDRDEENYSKTVEKRKKAGSMGGKQKVANASKCKQVVANLADKDTDKVKDKDTVKVKEKDNKAFTFSLTKSSQYQNLSSSYKEKLKGYAVVKDGAYQLQQFLDYHEAKGSTFKDWSKSYNTWLNNSKKFDKYNPEAYRQELNDHPDYDAVFVEYGTRKVYNAAYDFVVEFKVQQQAANVPAEEPTQKRDTMSLVRTIG